MSSKKNSTPNEIMVFRPTWSEFQNFSNYISYMESQGAHKAGVAKVIPPPEWVPRKKSYLEDDILNIEIPGPIRQAVIEKHDKHGNHGLYQLHSYVEKPMTVAEYKVMAESEEYKTPVHFDYADLERNYWKNIVNNPPLYGADVSGSITDNDVEAWNINKLGTVLDLMNEDYEGINTAYLYFGMWKSSFAWHTEDMDLYSINYIHEGYPKTWYAIPPEHGHRFEKLANIFFPTNFIKCPAHLRHKSILISPNLLKKHSIPFNKITHERGEFMITFPFGYHSGFNHGYNIAEAVNFASPRWVEYGKHARLCDCGNEAPVTISMDMFVKHLQPEKYAMWFQGNDIGCHPEDPSYECDILSDKNILFKMSSKKNSTPNEIMVFRPTWSEFQNFSNYISYMESQGAHKAGVAKVIPPPEWVPRKKSYLEDDILNIEIPGPIRQAVIEKHDKHGNHGLYQLHSYVEKPMTVAEYKVMAESEEYKTPVHFDYADLERNYWKNIVNNPPLYGADVSGSITDNDVEAWNINKLGTVLDLMNEDYEGINTAYLYFGMWKSSFAWHTEDMDLYSINYIHEGYPKTWYAIPPEHGHRFEKLANIFFPTNFIKCPAHLRHKSILISPNLLKKHSIPFNKITHERGEFMITFPFGYHSGFNHGYNIAEAVNFASPRWVEYGKHARLCDCGNEAPVTISMDMFVKHLQPEKYAMWFQGNDIGCHPEDPSYECDILSDKNISETDELQEEQLDDQNRV